MASAATSDLLNMALDDVISHSWSKGGQQRQEKWQDKGTAEKPWSKNRGTDAAESDVPVNASLDMSLDEVIEKSRPQAAGKKWESNKTAEKKEDAGGYPKESQKWGNQESKQWPDKKKNNDAAAWDGGDSWAPKKTFNKQAESWGASDKQTGWSTKAAGGSWNSWEKSGKDEAGWNRKKTEYGNSWDDKPESSGKPSWSSNNSRESWPTKNETPRAAREERSSTWAAESKSGTWSSAGGDSWSDRRGVKRSHEEEPSVDARPCKQVRVANIPNDLDWRDIKDAFEQEGGKIVKCNVDDRGNAWLTFERSRDAQKTVDTFNKGELNGSIIEVYLDR